MNKFKTPIDEGLANDITSQMVYCLFVDAYFLSTKKGGLMLNMFPNVGAKKLYRWVGGFPSSEAFSKNAEALKSMAQRLGGNSTLKTLYRVINTLKTKQTEQEKNDGRINDIHLVMSKIERLIKSKLTPEEKQLFSTISAELQDAADNAGKSIEGSVGASTIRPQAPAQPEQPETQPTQPKTEPKEPPTEEPPTEEPPAEEPPAEEPPAEEPPAEQPPSQKPSQKPSAPEPSAEQPPPAKKQAPVEKPQPKQATQKAPPKQVTPQKQEPTEPEESEEEEKTASKPKQESLTYEQYEQKIKALIKEIVRKKLGL